MIVGTLTYGSLQLNHATNKIKATHHSEELAEWLKFKRETEDYAEINDHIGSYCFNNEINVIDWPIEGGCDSNSYTLNNIFKRELLITEEGTNTNCEITTRDHDLDLKITRQEKLNIRFSEYDL